VVLTQVQVVDVRQRGQFGVDLDSCAHISDRVQQLEKNHGKSVGCCVASIAMCESELSSCSLSEGAAQSTREPPTVRLTPSINNTFQPHILSLF
jgi:hypothetical protein